MTPDSGEQSSYLVHSTSGRLYLRLLDALLRIVVRNRRPQPPIHRLLLGVGGHIGDATIASCAFPWIRAALPDAEIGVVLSSASRPILDGHPNIQWFHGVDHWKLSRSSAPWVSRYRLSARSQRNALEEIRRVGYDAAVDLYPYYPNMSVLFWRAGIRASFGYRSGGGGPAFTEALSWSNGADHVAVQQRRLLGCLVPGVAAPLHYDLPALSDATLARGRSLLSSRGLASKSYAVLHPGSGHPRKGWPVAKWTALANALTAAGQPVVLTGAGQRERRLVDEIRAAAPRCVDLCDQTDLLVLRYVLREASFVVAIDSAVSHLAAAESVAVTTLMSHGTNVDQWRPLGSHAATVMESATADDVRRAIRIPGSARLANVAKP